MASKRFSLDRSTPALWRVTFDNPPINLIDPVMIVALHDLLTGIERDKRVAVVVFDSADPDFFLATTTSPPISPPSTRCRRRPPRSTTGRTSSSGWPSLRR